MHHISVKNELLRPNDKTFRFKMEVLIDLSILIAENKNSGEINQLKHFTYQGILHAFSLVLLAFVRDFFYIDFSLITDTMTCKKKRVSKMKRDHKIVHL